MAEFNLSTEVRDLAYATLSNGYSAYDLVREVLTWVATNDDALNPATRTTWEVATNTKTDGARTERIITAGPEYTVLNPKQGIEFEDEHTLYPVVILEKDGNPITSEIRATFLTATLIGVASLPTEIIKLDEPGQWLVPLPAQIVELLTKNGSLNMVDDMSGARLETDLDMINVI